MLYRILMVGATLAILTTPCIATESAIPETATPEIVAEQVQQPEGIPQLSLVEELALCPADAAPNQAQTAGKVEARTLPDNWNPALCWRCGDYCTSDNTCFGMNAGDRCSNDGRTCVAFSGCALFNCCRCQ